MKHVNAEMIKAVADNTELVIFFRQEGVCRWSTANIHLLIRDPEYREFFLCLPQHKEACLHWLNGGDVQQSPLDIEQWVTTGNKRDWMNFHSFMQEGLIFKIKPKKEKRWICITDNLEIEDGTLYESLKDANENSPGYKQIIEIEVEVKL